jgi:hypothetical protein
MRAFEVTFSKEFTTVIVAKDEETLEEAIRNSVYDLEKFDFDPEWDWSVHDQLKGVKNPLTFKYHPIEAELGVVDGEVTYIEDYARLHPGYADAIVELAEEYLRQKAIEKVNLKLPGFG